LNEAILNYLEAINIGMKPTLMKKGDLMISMVIKAGMCALHVLTSLRKCACDEGLSCSFLILLNMV